MVDSIRHCSLNEFLCSNPQVDFGKIAFGCMAVDLLETKSHWDEFGKYVTNYTFQKIVRECYLFCEYKVIYIPDYSYVLYKDNTEKYQIWVAYTEEHQRKKGYMSKLLLDLVDKHPTKNVEVHTHNSDLEKLAIKAKISILSF